MSSWTQAAKVFQESIAPAGTFYWSMRLPAELDERQITHLICARLKYDLYDFFRGVFWGPFYIQEKGTGNRPKTPLKKSYRSYFRRATD